MCKTLHPSPRRPQILPARHSACHPGQHVVHGDRIPQPTGSTNRHCGNQQHCLFSDLRRGDAAQDHIRRTVRLHRQRVQRLRRHHRDLEVGVPTPPEDCFTYEVRFQCCGIVPKIYGKRARRLGPFRFEDVSAVKDFEAGSLHAKPEEAVVRYAANHG